MILKQGKIKAPPDEDGNSRTTARSKFLIATTRDET
jgi:hypothetical protein